jgi:hypothetical protein
LKSKTYDIKRGKKWKRLIVSKFHFFCIQQSKEEKRGEFLISAFQGIFIFQLQYLRKRLLWRRRREKGLFVFLNYFKFVFFSFKTLRIILRRKIVRSLNEKEINKSRKEYSTLSKMKQEKKYVYQQVS